MSLEGPGNKVDTVATEVVDAQRKGVEVGQAHMAGWVAPDWRVSLTDKRWCATGGTTGMWGAGIGAGGMG